MALATLGTKCLLYSKMSSGIHNILSLNASSPRYHCLEVSRLNQTPTEYTKLLRFLTLIRSILLFHLVLHLSHLWFWAVIIKVLWHYNASKKKPRKAPFCSLICLVLFINICLRINYCLIKSAIPYPSRRFRCVCDCPIVC